jgi:hypothetical protein
MPSACHCHVRRVGVLEFAALLQRGLLCAVEVRERSGLLPDPRQPFRRSLERLGLGFRERKLAGLALARIDQVFDLGGCA